MNDLCSTSPSLPQFASVLKEMWPDIEIHPCQILGRIDPLGSKDPLPTSTARLTIGNGDCWIPWPIPDADCEGGTGVASVFLDTGIRYVFPTIRLRVRSTENESWECLSLDDWLSDAFTRWRFEFGPKESTPSEKSDSADPDPDESDISKSRPKLTVLERLPVCEEENGLKETLEVVGRVVRYALWGYSKGSLRYKYATIFKRTKLDLDEREPWLRQVDESKCVMATNFHLRSMRALAITASADCLGDCGSEAKKHQAHTIERIGAPRIATGQSSKSRLKLQDENAHGFDPFHTSEDEHCRLTLHLGKGVTVQNRRLQVPETNPRTLSHSTIRLPYAGYNEPRRLLMAAKMQSQAVPVLKTEPPQVIVDELSDTSGPLQSDVDPPGVNLRVGYLAWAGWNHEDAWVISESAARRLVLAEEHVQTIPIQACETEAGLKFGLGDRVRKRDCLIEHRVAPAFLWMTLDKLDKLPGIPALIRLGNGEYALPASKEDEAEQDGIISRIETWDFIRGTKQIQSISPERKILQLPEQPLEYHLPNAVRVRYRKLIRFHIRQGRPVHVGDKLANRHGHKGVVGRILPDKLMPRWQGRALEALIDPISVINRANWGQIYETLAGAIAEERQEPSIADQTLQGMQCNEAFQEAFPSADSAGRSWVEFPGRDRKRVVVVKTDTDLGVLTTSDPQADEGPDEYGEMLETLGLEDVRQARESDPGEWVRAVAGVQFVMRLPEHADDKVATGIVPKGDKATGEEKKAKFDLFSHFALWAHGLGKPSPPYKLTPNAEQFRRLLRLAGFELTLHSKVPEELASDFPEGYIEIRRLNVGGSPPAGEVNFTFPENTSPKRALLGLDRERPGYLRIDPPLRISQEDKGKTDILSWDRICWFPLVSTKDCPGSSKNGYPDQLTQRLWNLYKEARKDSSKRADQKLRTAIRQVVFTAYGMLVGSDGVESKEYFLEEEVLGVRLERSGRAVITPRGFPYYKGPQPHSLDEISIPLVIAKDIFPDLVDDSTQETNGGQESNEVREFNDRIKKEKRRLWIKRDPLLHRWGLLDVSFEVHKGSTIQLPASLLEPLAADYDGDEMSIFAVDEGEEGTSRDMSPSANRQHELWGRAMFVPSKQYVYGMHLLEKRPENHEWFQDFHKLLEQKGAAQWPKEDDLTAKEKLADWAYDMVAQGQLLREQENVIETHALLALESDPGMQLGLFHDVEELLKLEVIECGAANKKLYECSEKHGLNTGQWVMQGRSLDLHEWMWGGGDPIGEIMAKAIPLKGEFGNVIKDLIGRAHKLLDKKDANGRTGRDFLEAAQALHEELVQKVLSVKTVASNLPKTSDYRKEILTPLISRQEPGELDKIKTVIDTVKKDIVEAGIWEILRSNLTPEPAPCMQWLRNPHELRNILAKLEQDAEQDPEQEAVLRLPLDDMRCWPFVSVAGS